MDLSFCLHLLCLSPPIMSVPTFYLCPPLLCLFPPFMSVPTDYQLCLSQPIMSVPTFYVYPHLLCLSPPIMSVPTFYVCPHRLPIMSVPTYYVCPHPSFFCSQALLKSRVWHSQLSLLLLFYYYNFYYYLKNRDAPCMGFKNFQSEIGIFFSFPPSLGIFPQVLCFVLMTRSLRGCAEVSLKYQKLCSGL